MRRRFLSNINKSISEYFTIEALEDGLTAKLSTNSCEYCIDNGNWNNLSADSNTPSINKGQTLSFKGNLMPSSSKGIGTFTISKKCNLKGNIMSMLYGDDFVDKKYLTNKDYAFYSMFYNCRNIVEAHRLILPATGLSLHCYSNMFAYCTSLVTAPELPSKYLKDYCYLYMFRYCSSLTQAPELPATTLAESCYYSMFEGCRSLVTAPDLPATIMITHCYYSMFSWCTSLVTAPELPATKLLSWCYEYMFNGCTKLNYIKALFTTILDSSCTLSWVSGVSSTGTFVKSKDATWNVTGDNGVPTGWTVQTV